jgi:hypothetical protein
MYPCLKLLTGDAIYAGRPLITALQKYHCDYLFQGKDNQSKIREKLEAVFADAPNQEPDDYPEIVDEVPPKKTRPRRVDRQTRKKRGLWRSADCG